MTGINWNKIGSQYNVYVSIPGEPSTFAHQDDRGFIFYDKGGLGIAVCRIIEHRPEPIKLTLSPGATMPTRGSDGAAGYDLYALEDTTINCFQFIPVSTGVSIEIPAGHYGRVAPRSGLAVKHGVMVGAGVIDSDYRGELKVALATLNGVYEFKKGDRIAQLIIERIATPELVQVDSLDDTDRGDGGFGSTGK